MQTVGLDRIHSNVTFGVSCYFSSWLSISSTPGSVSVPSCYLEHRDLHLTSDLHHRARIRRNLEKAGTTCVLLQSKLLFSTPNGLGNKRQNHVCPCLNAQAADALLSKQHKPWMSAELLELLPLYRPKKPAKQTSRNSISSCLAPRAQDANVNTDRGSYLKTNDYTTAD